MLALTPTLGLSLALSLSRSTTQHLQQHGYAVVPNFVAPQTVEALKRDVSQLHAEGRFATAGVGESGTNRVETTVRKCQQCFIFPQFKYKSGGDKAARATLYGALESLRDDLQTHCSVPLDGLLTEGLYATYPNGGFYRRHVDAVEGTASAQRQWSYLLYLNTDWKEADGGCLRIHTDGGGELAPPGAAPSYVDVEPRAGTCAASFAAASAEESSEPLARQSACRCSQTWHANAAIQWAGLAGGGTSNLNVEYPGLWPLKHGGTRLRTWPARCGGAAAPLHLHEAPA